ncbi:MAG TPA: DUF1820 family protein [Desulfuromonadales bacterium]|nr:DUF1820 family protein [Desulfuromonadales bacterium]
MSETLKRIYRIFFSFNGKSYELYARQVSQADLYGFVAIEDILFGERSSLVVDPAEEALRKEFAEVRKILIPFQAVHRIDEVEKQGQPRILSLAGKNGQTPEASRSLPPVPDPKDAD